MTFLELLKDNAKLFFENHYLNLLRLFFFLILSIINIIFDIKDKKVLSISFIISSLIMLFFWLFYDFNLFVNCFIGFIGVIIIFLIIFFISSEGIGLGDMFYLAFFSSLYGYFFSIISFLFSFWIAFLILIVPYLLKKIDKKAKIPFIPFLFIGSILTIILGYFLVR